MLYTGAVFLAIGTVAAFLRLVILSLLFDFAYNHKKVNYIIFVPGERLSPWEGVKVILWLRVTTLQFIWGHASMHWVFKFMGCFYTTRG